MRGPAVLVATLATFCLIVGGAMASGPILPGVVAGCALLAAGLLLAAAAVREVVR